MAAMADLINGKPVDEVVPVLIVAAARALALEANGDQDKLEELGLKFCSLLADTANGMLGQEQMH